ncbi:DNA polymerase Y family protein [Nocardioides sp. W7]|uniref:DNA polymerase Y family protein n=1 Tax=Nocardioides sp. W7 TaxID=2931390 RepID=UPI001FCFB412|nr:DNA polymerase Y family protein [Nocardioides sp. W7]
MLGRVLVVWCPDWPVVAAATEAGLPGKLPAAVFHANLVQACNEPARALGVRRGMRRRDAQARCPELAVLPASPERDARAFEDVLVAVEEIRPGIAPLRPGLVALRSPGRFYGGEAEAGAVLAERLVALGVWDSRAGVADELFTAEQAARRAGSQESLVVPAGGSAEFLRALPVDVLDEPDAVSLLRRLGLRTLGDLARLRAADVRDRFGSHVAWVHRVVAGGGSVHLPTRTPPPELERHVDFEPPLDSAETIVFSARRTAEAFVAGIARQGLVCTEVRIEARCEGEDPQGRPASARTWLHPRFFTASDLVDRLHWQLGGSFRAGEVRSPIERVRFVPETVVPDAVHADVLWGGTDERVERGIARVQGMLGHDSVVVPVLQGGRGPADRQAWVPWGERATGLRPTGPPWPGSLPPPAPSRVLRTPWAAEVADRAGRPVALDDRGALTGEPARFCPGPDEDRQPVAAWAGPWVVEEQWWESGGRRVARFQLVGVDGRAWLLTLDGNVWWTEAAYE